VRVDGRDKFKVRRCFDHGRGLEKLRCREEIGLTEEQIGNVCGIGAEYSKVWEIKASPLVRGGHTKELLELVHRVVVHFRRGRHGDVGLILVELIFHLGSKVGRE